MKTELLDIRHCDCMELMREFPDKHFELAIVDPPYGMGESAWSGGGVLGSRKYIQAYREKQWDNVAPDSTFFVELMRVSVNQIVWGGNYFVLPPSRGVICWDKEQPMPSLSKWEMAWTSFDCTAEIYRQRSQDSDRIHPTQKPVALYRWLLANYAKAGDKILDTHLGPMSSVIACADMGFSITGCELDFDYYAAGIERVKRHLEQAVMFRNPVKLLVHDTIVMDF